MCQESKPCVQNNPFLSLTEQESLGIIAVILEDPAWEIGHMGSKAAALLSTHVTADKLLWPSGPHI